MLSRRSLAAAAALLLSGVTPLAAPPARAEVSAQTDAFGRYLRTIVVTQASVRQHRIWQTVRRSYWRNQALNPNGDRTGDMYPAIAENAIERRHPWAVWSRFNGQDYDLVWSRWRPGGWAIIERVEGEPAFGDDLAPSITFNTAGRPFLAWWRDDGGAGEVFVSLFLVTRWSEPILLSDPGVDSRNPRLTVMPSGLVAVEFMTPFGPESRIVALNGTTTITDDLNPVGQVSVTRIAVDGSH